MQNTNNFMQGIDREEEEIAIAIDIPTKKESKRMPKGTEPIKEKVPNVLFFLNKAKSQPNGTLIETILTEWYNSSKPFDHKTNQGKEIIINLKGTIAIFNGFSPIFLHHDSIKILLS